MKYLPLIGVVTVAVSMATSMTQAAGFAGETTNATYVNVDVSNVYYPGSPHTVGLAGISVEVTGVDDYVDFAGLTTYGSYANGVYSLNFPYTGAPASHSDLGVFHFAEVGSSDVWFGEWSNDGSLGNTTRTVYYSGMNADSSVPSSGTASYTVVGINNYDGSAGSLLNGTLSADFGAATLSGTLYNADFSSIVNLGSTTINSDASVTGSSALGLFSGTLVTSGAVSAQFYNGQTDLAGLVDFAGANYDVAFGGTKN
ncbi:MAG: hypothetical protein HRU06_08705 [Oceanospirillaceae bacterium]|nr:hypothetical protein [Oceanospirillaceae bacterium]